MPKPVIKPRKKTTGYKMPPPLPNGFIVEDIAKKKWKLGPSIGKGGFGEIYSAQEHPNAGTKSYPLVVKIEPHANGPLFVEMHFYKRAAKPADIQAFKTDRKLISFGMPEYLGSGTQEHNGEKYRFLVMRKFGSDLWKLFLENNRRFPSDTVFKLGVQILDVLEYIHSKGYIHGDVKAANVLLGIGKEAETQVYLVDFGLCTHYATVYKPDPKKAHNGTIEYLSRDAHAGVESRRGDLEILGYNLTQWLGCVLPWEKTLSDPVTVYNSKQKHMGNLTEFFKTCFKGSQAPDALVKYFKYITTLQFETDPDYKKIKQILQSGIEATAGSLKASLIFKSVATPGKHRQSKSLSPVKKPTKKGVLNGKVLSKTPTKQKAYKEEESDDGDEDDMVDVANSSSSGFTAEMLRIKEKLKAKKMLTSKLNSSTNRKLRKRKVTSYNENSFSSNRGDLDASVQIISNSESEDDIITKKRLIQKKK